ncbi:hypothetical protein BV20DRAFT_1057159 [Pilatotrama ljubarskyi]|nr:hypothetical protein BV20DRAFT_1057159 [Pilatotrama ljubarskyi]
MSVFSDPLISFANGDAFWASDPCAYGPHSESLPWMAIRLADNVSDGVIASRVVATENGVNVCERNPRPMFSFLLHPDLHVNSNEVNRTLTFIDSTQPGWQHHIRFTCARHFWDCLHAVTEGKCQAEVHREELAECMRKVLITFPTVCKDPDEASTGDADDFEDAQEDIEGEAEGDAPSKGEVAVEDAA